jgi:hypothetical protein
MMEKLSLKNGLVDSVILRFKKIAVNLENVEKVEISNPKISYST